MFVIFLVWCFSLNCFNMYRGNLKNQNAYLFNNCFKVHYTYRLSSTENKKMFVHTLYVLQLKIVTPMSIK